MEITMRLSLGLLSLTLFASLMNASCGKWAKASPEVVSTMERPSYPVVSNDVFSLNSSKSYISYKGTMVIFDHSATPVDTAELINASVDARLKWAESKKFQDDTNYNPTYGDDNAIAMTQLKLMKDGLQKFDLEALNKTPIDALSRLKNAETLIEREIASLNLSADAKASFDASWGHYCEAKIIEFAAHPLLAQTAFKTKPSPAPLCAKYYSDNAMMTSTDCSPQTGDYLKCIWIDGVAKTRWFSSLGETANADIARAREEKRTKLLELFSEANYESTKNVLGFVESAFTTSAAFKKLYFDKKDSLLSIAIRQTNDTRCARAILNVGTQGFCTLFGLSTEQFSPKQVIDAMEGVSSTFQIMTDLSAPAGRSYTTQQMIQYVNKRNAIENSESDRLFLEPMDGIPLPSPDFSKFGAALTTVLPDIRSGLGAEFYGTFSAADLSARILKVDAIQKQEALINFNSAEYLRYLEAAGAGSERGAAAANRPGFSKGFLTYEMIYQQVNNIISAELEFEDQNLYAFRACLNLDTNLSVPCPDTFQLRSEVTYLPATIAWAQDGGKLEFSFKLENVDAIGFGQKDRKPVTENPSFFMDLPATETEGKTLRFELYRNRILDALDIMTGKAFIEDGTTRHWEAGISMWENVG